MSARRSYSDDQLREAIGISTSWRGVLRGLGLTATSSGAMRSVRSHADRIGADYKHFLGQRRWLENDLRVAIAGASDWRGVLDDLGLDRESDVGLVEGHTMRLGIDVSHLKQGVPRGGAGIPSENPELAHLGRAGPLLAAAWFTLCGYEVSWPLEPSRHDLLAANSAGIRRVQVKTTTVRTGSSWKVYLSMARRGRTTYRPGQVDDFFVIDGDLSYYLIPLAAVGGLQAIHLSAYRQFKVAQSL